MWPRVLFFHLRVRRDIVIFCHGPELQKGMCYKGAPDLGGGFLVRSARVHQDEDFYNRVLINK